MEEHRTCVKCQETKPISQFYKFPDASSHKGYRLTVCRQCTSAYLKEYGQRNREKIRESHRAAYRRNLNFHKASSKKYRSEHPDRVREAYRRTYQKNPLASQAHSAVRIAVKKGVLPPANTMVCEDCQENLANQWHHHQGYTKESWLDVIALCGECHSKTRIAELSGRKNTSERL